MVRPGAGGCQWSPERCGTLLTQPEFPLEGSETMADAAEAGALCLRDLTLCLPLLNGEGGRLRTGLPCDLFFDGGKTASQASSLSRRGVGGRWEREIEGEVSKGR